jgi:AcrR family transcriptional regulator
MDSVTKLNSRRELMRSQILTCAVRLFARKGLDAVSLQEIAAELQISKTALYHYFAGRNDLIRAVFADFTVQRLKDIKAVALGDAPPATKLRNLIHSHVKNLVADFDLFKLSFRQEENLPSEVRAEYRQLKREADLVLRDLIREGIASGDFEGVDARLTTFSIFGMCNWMVNWYHPEDRLTPEEVANFIYRLVLFGISKNVQAVDGTRADIIARLAKGMENELGELRAELASNPRKKFGQREP